jgi:hypothetical protein
LKSWRLARRSPTSPGPSWAELSTKNAAARPADKKNEKKNALQIRKMRKRKMRLGRHIFRHGEQHT